MPVSLLVALRTCWVLVLMIVTTAPTTTAPVASVVVPVISPNCKAYAPSRNTGARKANRLIMLHLRCPATVFVRPDPPCHRASAPGATSVPDRAHFNVLEFDGILLVLEPDPPV